MSSDKPFIIACIPVKNEENSIAKVIVKTMKYVDHVIICDDGSKDLTADIAEKLGSEVVRHERNLGYGAALGSLFSMARKEADIMVTIDGDDQHDPDDIPRLVEPIISGEADIVIGSRFLNSSKDSAPGYRQAGIKIITKLAESSLDNGITDAQSGLRAYNKKALRLTKPGEMGMGASTEILIKAKDNGLNIKEIPINITYGEETSTHNPLYHGLDVILSTVKHLSIRHPLLFYGIPGLFLLLVGLIFGIWTLQLFAATRQVVTNVALIAIGSSIVGTMLLTTGIMLWILVTLLRAK